MAWQMEKAVPALAATYALARAAPHTPVMAASGTQDSNRPIRRSLNRALRLCVVCVVCGQA